MEQWLNEYVLSQIPVVIMTICGSVLGFLVVLWPLKEKKISMHSKKVITDYSYSSALLNTLLWGLMGICLFWYKNILFFCVGFTLSVILIIYFSSKSNKVLKEDSVYSKSLE